MIVNLVKHNQMFSLTLPQKVKGQYWLEDTDLKGRPRKIISVEAVQGEWVLKSNLWMNILNASNEITSSAVLTAMSFFNLQYNDVDDRENGCAAFLFAEEADESRRRFEKYVLPVSGREVSFNIGREEENNFCFQNKFVSTKHAKLIYKGNGSWFINDLGSTNGTYVNGRKISSCQLSPGDCIYIMGLKIIIGYNFLAVNNPDNRLKIHSKSLEKYYAQQIENAADDMSQVSETKFFFRPPRFCRAIEKVEIKIDPPPQPQRQETVPMALMMGPSLTMGLTSLSTGLLTVNNVLSSGGQISQALPTMMMSVSMLLGTVLWPILTKRYEKKQKNKNELKRQEKYLAYLDRLKDDIRKECRIQSDILAENCIAPEKCAARIFQHSTDLWERVISQEDFLRLRLGIGKLPLSAEVKYPEKKFTLEDDNLQDAMLSLGTMPKELDNVPVSISLIENSVVGIYGSYGETTALLKAMVLQLVSLHSYDELKLVMLADGPSSEEWSFVRFIPHFWNDERTTRFFAVTADEVRELSACLEETVLARHNEHDQDYADCMPYYVIIAIGETMAKKCGAIQQMLHSPQIKGLSLLLSAEELKELPKETRQIVCVEGQTSRIFDRSDTSGRALRFVPDSMNGISMYGIVDAMAGIKLDVGTQQYTLPGMMTFLEMFHVGKIEHLNSLTRWKENNPVQTLQTPVGVNIAGESFFLDLHEKFHGPHGLVAGMTGSGKSEFIITYILSLAVNYHPEEVAFILIDYKGGGLTGAFEDDSKGIKLPHLAGTITNLDGTAVKRSLISIQSELRRRQAVFNEARKLSNEGTMDIYKYQQLYRNQVVKEPVPHLFIISDEFAELKTQQPEFMEQLISAARIGRSLGVHLILATQKPSGVVDDQIWSNSKFRVCLKVQEKADSQDMIKCPDAAELSQTGRFYLQVGFNELFALGQSAWCGAEYIPADTVEKTVDADIQVIDNLGRVMLNVKAEKKRAESGGKIKQVVGIVKYLSDLAEEENIRVRPLWLPPIPAYIYIDQLEQKYGKKSAGTFLNPIVGEYDDPFNQRQEVLTVPFSEEGNCLLYGSAGNGKLSFLTTLCYSLIRSHRAEEVNLYLMDFGSETLRVFEAAPQVGGVVTSVDEEKLVNLFKLLSEQMELRRGLFAEYGGDYASYCKGGGKILPNIVVIINNYSGFAEQYEDLQETLTLLTRDGVKYGIYFVVAANSSNAVRYRITQNFKMIYTMQLNDVSEYSVLLGKTDGLQPSRYKGRGLVALDRVYEFQTALCKNVSDSAEYLRGFCGEMQMKGGLCAEKIPILPESVTLEHVQAQITDLKNVPIGVEKSSLKPAMVNLANKLIFPVTAQEIYQTADLAKEMVKVLECLVRTVVIDAEQMLHIRSGERVESVIGDYETCIQKLFADMAQRNNTYKDARMDARALDLFEEIQVVIFGVRKLFDILSEDGKDKLNILLEKGEAFYKLRFIVVDSVQNFGMVASNTWYRRHITGADGLWIGEGIADQYMLKLNKVTSELYEEIGDSFGYLLSRNKPVRIKQLAPGEEA